MLPDSENKNLKEQLDSAQSTASISTASSLGAQNEPDRARGYTITTENYPGSIQDSMSSFASSSKSSKGKEYDAQTAVQTATEKQRKTVGVFQVEPLFGNDKLELSVTHLPMSTSGVIRMPGESEVANCYWNIYNKNGSCSVHTGAAQGVNEEFDFVENKYKKTKQHDYVEDQLLTHLASGLLGHMVQHEYNHDPSFSIKPENLKPLALEGYQAPRLLQISNYMTDLFVPYEDAAQIAPRKKYIENLLKNIKTANGKRPFDFLRFIGIKKDNTREAQAEASESVADFQEKLIARVISIAQQKGLVLQDSPAVIEEAASTAVKSILQPGKLLFNRQGLNAFRIFAAWSDSAELRASATARVVELTASLKSEQDLGHREEILQKIAQIKSTSNELLGAEIRYGLTQFLSNILLGIPSAVSVYLNRRVGALSNIPLHKEALKLNLVSLIGGADVGGCQSAKDRFGSLICFTRAQEDYIVKYGSAPPAYGLLGFFPGAINVITNVASRVLSFAVDLGLSVTLNTIGLFYTHAPERRLPEMGALTTYNFLGNIATSLQRGVGFLHDYQNARRARLATVVEAAGLLKDYGPDRQNFFKERVAEHWISGAMQYVADANAAGALGIKNNSQIIPSSYREAINQKIEEKIQQHYENIVRLIQANPKQAELALKESHDLQQIQYLMKCFPVISEQLANINEAVKKDDIKAAKSNAKIQKNCSTYLEPVLKEIFTISAQSRLQNVTPQEQILRSQLEGHILALATISYPKIAAPEIAASRINAPSSLELATDDDQLERRRSIGSPEIAIGAVLPPEKLIREPVAGVFSGSKVTANADKNLAEKNNQGNAL